MDTMKVEGSFRDHAGFVFSHHGTLYRQVNASYQVDYKALMDSGFYGELVRDGLLIPHEEVVLPGAVMADAYKVIRPEQIPFISYPYEWCFSQIKDAALLTLEIQRRALDRGLSLKDASAYNVQFIGGHAVFIDTLSFEKYQDGTPWVAYRQFCQHFLAPLALMSHTDVRLGQLLRIFIDGVPLDLAATLLPALSKWNLSLGLHIAAHARSQRKYADKGLGKHAARSFSRRAFIGLLDSLHGSVAGLEWCPNDTEWHDYYEANNNYGEQGLAEKARLVAAFLDAIRPGSVWDLGANTGRFSQIAAASGAYTVAWDIDMGCVDSNYRQTKENGANNLLPLILDLTNPSAAIGWANRERMSFAERGPVDTIMALGLIHHLAIGNNVPLANIAEYLHSLCRHLVVEFIPKEDSQVSRLLVSRKDIFTDYSQGHFEAAFKARFIIESAEVIPGTSRVLYRMKGKSRTRC